VVKWLSYDVANVMVRVRFPSTLPRTFTLQALTSRDKPAKVDIQPNPEKGDTLKYIIALVMGLALFAPTAALGDKPDVTYKSYVCKYVGKPGVDERLQTGQNPIWVSNASLGLGAKGLATVGQVFNDAQGKSVVVVANTPKFNPEPSVDTCPKPQGPPDDEDEFASVNVSTIAAKCVDAPEPTDPDVKIYGQILFGTSEGVAHFTVDGFDGTYLPGQRIEQAEPGTYTVRAVLEDGYVFETGNGVFTVTVGDDAPTGCVAGTETPTPDPDPEPTPTVDPPRENPNPDKPGDKDTSVNTRGDSPVKTPVAVPTAVAAGLAGAEEDGPDVMEFVLGLLVGGLVTGAGLLLLGRKNGKHTA
jgi:hypothetical protein